MTTIDQIAGKIIKEQELIIGPLAWDEAFKVEGLRVVDKRTGIVSIDANVDSKIVVDNLVKEYELLFGRAAREVCRDAAMSLVADLPPSEIPSSLK